MPASGMTVSPAGGLVTRQSTQYLSKVKGGMLVKDGKATSCGVGFLDNMAAMISATCLDMKNGAVDKSVKYEILIDDAYNGVSERYPVTDFKLHPSFNAETLANNVAVIQFNKGSDVTWYNYSWQPTGKADSPELIYAQRVLTDVKTSTWGTVQISQGNRMSDAACTDLSPLYKANPADLICNDAVYTAPVSGLTQCKVPSQTVYAYIGGIAFQAGFFSYAMVKGGNDLCDYKQVRTYFTLMASYLAFAQAAVNRTVYYYEPTNTTSPQTNPFFEMDSVAGVAGSVAKMVSGDMYGSANDGNGNSNGSSGGDGVSQTDDGKSSGKNTSSNNSSSNSGDSSSGLATKTIIIIAVCSSLGSLLFGLSIFLVVWCLRRKVFRARDPYLETNAQNFLANDIGGASPPAASRSEDDAFIRLATSKPPPYRASEIPEAAPRPNQAAEIHPAGFHVPPPSKDMYPDEKA
ncbi:hypothetical protein LPJ61_005063 [Coemansia biformis]|uniref:Peptidase S1 domain-containing protein n=1 Tax=Coemansia biformis TaxID=1286918 RepID=A0A9W7Y7G0_9FUNG|nr:hypothetical protein LPJ61_005063 [Coemansia biformis]